MASGDSVQQIKDRLSVVDVVSSYVELHQAGKNFKGKSPFTNEKTPSFYVSPDRGMYYCFSSSQGGDIFSFIQAMEGVDFKGALKILAEKAGIELVPEDPKKKTERDRQYDVLEDATKFYEKYLSNEKSAQQYLEDRGVKAETRARWRLGYSPGPPQHGWRELKVEFEAKGFTQTELVRAGLIKGLDTGKEPYDVFRDRLMFPIFDAGGRVVAYSGRILSKDSEAPKYVNSPETELFNKSEVLYGYDKAKQGIRQFDFSLIVEGQFDVVLAHQAGYSNTVAVSGTALTAHHVMLLQRLSNKVVLALDADRAGIAAVKRAADLMLSRGIDVKVAHMPDGSDPADMINNDPSEFKKVIGKAAHVIEYLLEILEEEGKDERTFKLKAREEILPYVARIPNKIDQDHFEALIAEKLKTTKEAIHYEVERIVGQLAEKESIRLKAEDSRDKYQASAEDKPVALNEATRKKELVAHLAVMSDVLQSTWQNVLRASFSEFNDISLETILASLDAAERSHLTFTLESYIAETKPTQLAEEITDQLNELAALKHKEQLRELKEVLKEAEARAEETDVLSAITAIAELQKAPAKVYDKKLFED